MSANEITVNIKLYGILNRYIKNDEVVSLKIPGVCSHTILMENLYQTLVKNNQLTPEKMQELKQLIDSSAFAKNDEIFDEADMNLQLQHNDSISVLPPVCGG